MPRQHRPLSTRQPKWDEPWSKEWEGEQILTKLRDAVRTGWLCSLEDNPHEAPIPAISPSRFVQLTENELWPRAMRAIAEIEKVHPRAQRRFHRSWPGNAWMVRALVGDDDVNFAVLRKMFPPYRGGAKLLYRGQLQGMWVGPSWTTNYMVAEEYAFDGVDEHWRAEEVKHIADHKFRIPRHLMLRPLPNRRPVILRATMRGEIISSRLPQRRDGFKHDEFICDPRAVTYESFSTLGFRALLKRRPQADGAKRNSSTRRRAAPHSTPSRNDRRRPASDVLRWITRAAAPADWLATPLPRPVANSSSSR